PFTIASVSFQRLRTTIHSFPTRRSSDLSLIYVCDPAQRKPDAKRERDSAKPQGTAQPQVTAAGETACAKQIAETLARRAFRDLLDRKSTRLNSSHQIISYAVCCLK